MGEAARLPAACGLNFVGCRNWRHHRHLRRQSVVTKKRRLKAIQRQFAASVIGLDKVRATVSSWVDHASYADTNRSRAAVLGGATFTRSQEAGERRDSGA